MDPISTLRERSNSAQLLMMIITSEVEVLKLKILMFWTLGFGLRQPCNQPLVSGLISCLVSPFRVQNIKISTSTDHDLNFRRCNHHQ